MTLVGQKFIYSGRDLSQWLPVHSARLLERDGSFIFNDGQNSDWHLIRLEDMAFCLRRLRLHIVLIPTPAGTANIYIHHFGGKDVLEVARDGTIVCSGTAEFVQIKLAGDGKIDISLEYISRHSTINIGTSKSDPKYAAVMDDQFELFLIEIECLEPLNLFGPADPSRRIRLVDVGGAGGLQAKWLGQAEMISPILFEPNPNEAMKLRPLANLFPEGQVIEQGLADLVGRQRLNITRYFGCTSLLRPNVDLLSRYRIASAFDVIDTVEIECTRYDVLHKYGLVPVPDVIKVDVQGYEYQVLHGFGHLLSECLAIELEAHFYPIYMGQKLLSDLVSLLLPFQFVLRKIQPVPNFDGDLVEVDAIFTKDSVHMRQAPNLVQEKMHLIARVLGLPTSLEQSQ
jgi:FkbM family methyltransferase